LHSFQPPTKTFLTAMSGGDLLGDIFEPQLGSPLSKSSREDISFDFDPDSAKAVDLFCANEASAMESQPGVGEGNLEDMFGGPASTSTAALPTVSGGTDSATGRSVVDQDELRRRIRGGGGSEKPSLLQRTRAAASDAAGGAVARIRGLPCGLPQALQMGGTPCKGGLTPRFILGSLVLLLILGGGIYVRQRASSDSSLEETVIVNEAARTPAKNNIRKPGSSATSAKKESLLDEEMDHSSKTKAAEAPEQGDDGEEESSSRKARSGDSGAAGVSGVSANEFASLQRAVEDSKGQILEELRSLRREVSRLKDGAGKEEQSSASDVQPQSQDRAYSPRGEVHSEKPRYGGKAAAAADAPRTRASRGAAARARATAAVAAADEKASAAEDEAEAAHKAAAKNDDDAGSSDSGGRDDDDGRASGSISEIVSR